MDHTTTTRDGEETGKRRRRMSSDQDLIDKDFAKDHPNRPYDSRQARKSRLRYKSRRTPSLSDKEGHDVRDSKKRRESRGQHEGESMDENGSGAPKRHHSHRSRHRTRSSRTEKAKKTLDTSRRDDDLDPDSAFRESLFDAMADDEGADYWEGVYGQPIHTYSNMREGPQGALERMTDEEYVTFVRQKMWEKSHQHLLEERQRRDQAAKEKRERQRQTERADSERERFNKMMDESLQRGQARRADKRWKEAWEAYVKNWELLNNNVDKTNAGNNVPIPWPVLSGRVEDINKAEVESFLTHTLPKDSADKSPLLSLLKLERVKWHPDRVQQRLGKYKMDEQSVRGATAVFQIIDALWMQHKGS